MSFKLRLILIVNTLLILSIVLSLILIVLNSAENTQSEILSSKQLASYAIRQSIQKNPEYIKYLKANRTLGISELITVRHLLIEYYNKNDLLLETNLNQNTQERTPAWFSFLLSWKQKQQYEHEIIPLNISGRDIGYIKLTPDPTSEFNEIWEQFKNSLLVTIIFVVLINVSIFIIFSRILSPINQLIHSFDKLAKKQFNVAVPLPKILEFNALSRKFNAMARQLKKNNDEIMRLNRAIDLHDDFAQSLAAIQAEAYVASEKQSQAFKNNQLKKIISISKSMIQDLRTLLQSLNLGIIDEVGIETALNDLIDQWIKKNNQKNVGLELKVTKKLNTLDKRQIVNLYRIIQECLTNISKHSDSKKTSISILENREQLKILVRNNGIRKPKIETSGLGLIGMRERVAALNGSFSAKKIKDNFVVTVLIPLAGN
jgi:two-component system sensor histidine kinase UhpB